MKKILLIISCFIITSGISAQTKSEETNSNVTTCTEFHVTLPLRDLVKMYPVDKKKDREERESFDRQYRPHQIFLHTAAEGPQYGEDPAIRQTEMGTRSPENKAPIKNWAGQVDNSGIRPFDPTGAAGPNHYVQAINSTSFRVYNKSTGATMLTGDLASLWSPATADDGDPIVMYDKFADRWFISQFGQTGNSIFIAISTTADPTGSYYTYTFTSPQFPDYLKFSIWENGYYMTSNQATDKVFCFERTQMLAGNSSARSISANFTTGSVSAFFIPLPADAADNPTLPTAGTPLPFFAYYDNAWGGGNDGVNIWKMTVTWGTTPAASITAATLIQTSLFDASYNATWDDVTQPGTTSKLDGIGGVPTYRAPWRSWSGYNSVVLNWGVLISSSTGQRSIRWVELRQNQSSGTWSLYQEGTYTPDAHTRWMGSIAMDNNGSIALCYCKSSSTIYPSLCYTGRLASDPLGTMTFAETVAIAGTSTQTSTNRFGDYAHTSLDPDGITFWHTGEYIASGVKTRIYSFQLPAGALAPVANFSADPTSTNCSGNVQFTDLSSNAPTSWLWNFGDGQTSTSQNPLHTYAVSGTYSVTLTATNTIGNNQMVKNNFITIDIPVAPTTTGATICSSGTAVLHASGVHTLNWYSAATGGTLVNTGTSFTTPTLTSTTTYYVEDVSPAASVSAGKPDNTGGGNVVTGATSYLIFDCYTPLTLVSVDIYFTGAGARTVELRNSSGTILQSAVVTLGATSPQTCILNFNIPVGTNLQLGATGTTINLYRNNAGVTFPYTTAGLLSITGASTAARYYFFYNWQIQGPGCGSARTPVTATVTSGVAPTVSIAASSSSICTGTSVTFTATPANGGASPTYQWKLNGSNVGSNLPTYSNASLANGNTVTCVMTSALSCASPTTATSNTVTMSVSGALAPAVSVSPSANNICTGTDVTFTATPTNGGASPTYQWKLNGSNVGSNLPTYSNATLANSNTVSCVMTSALSCANPTTATSNTTTMIVIASVTPSVVISASPSLPVCPGTSVLFTATPTNGGTNTGYQWTVDGVNAGTGSTLSGVYNQGQIISCIMTSSATCASPATASASPLTVNIYAVSPVTVTDIGGTLMSGATSGNQWYEQSSGIINGANSQNYTPTSTGDYYCVVTDTHGCITTTNSVHFIAVGIDDQNSNYGISIYPNPTNGLVNISFEKALNEGKIVIEDALGQKVYEYNLKQTDHSVKVIDFKDFAVGVYFININNENINFRKRVVFDTK